MIEQIDTLSTIASAFSDFAKMPANKNEVIELNQVLKLALDIFKSENIIFKPSEQKIFVKIDKTQLIRVVTNIIKNALQAIENETEPRIEIDVTEKADHVIIEMEDNGNGISDDIIDRIFEPQFTTKTSGMGLGLSMVKKIIDNNQGKIEVESQKNSFTKFIITLPKIIKT
jgi:signal transduction histidine kinase